MKFFFGVFIASFIGILISGDNLYNPHSQFCCNGTVHNKPFISGGYYCCNTELVQRTTTSCCSSNGDQVSHLNVLRTELDCCYTGYNTRQLYNPKLEACCHREIIKKPNSYQHYRCCGKELYDNYAQICCDGVIYEYRFNVECCGTKLIKTNGNTNTECCGDVIIDTTQKICCKTKKIVNKFDFPSGDPQKPYYDVVIYDKTSSKQECCGLKLYDKGKEICCQVKEQSPYTLQLPMFTFNGGGGSAICCGNSVILDRTKEICCGDVVHARPSVNVECCNKEVLYDYSTHICCGRNIYEKENSNDRNGRPLTCCRSAGKLYDSNSHLCCGDQIFPRPISSKKPVACCVKH